MTHDPYQVPVNPGQPPATQQYHPQPGVSPESAYTYAPPPPPRRKRGRAVVWVLVVALVVAVVGAGTIAYALFRDTPTGRAVSGALGLDRTYTQADADKALLTVADLPGYSVMPADGDDNDPSDDMKPCGGASKVDAEPQDGTDRQAVLAKGLLGPFVIHVTGLLRSGTTLEPVRDAFKGCTTWKQGADSYTVAEANYGSYGDETVSYKLTVKTSVAAVGMSMVFVRKGNLVSFVVLAGFPDVSGDEVLAVARKAAEKLPA